MKTILHRTILSLALGIAFVASASLCEAATIGVPSLGNSTIQSAIDNAVDGEDTVIVSRGTYTENIDFKGKEITVKSKYGAATTTIDGNASGSVVVFENNEVASSVLSGFTIRNGLANDGGGIICDGSSPTIVNCLISSNTAVANGGGIYCSNSSPTIINCTISSNNADGEGGGVWGDSS